MDLGRRSGRANQAGPRRGHEWGGLALGLMNLAIPPNQTAFSISQLAVVFNYAIAFLCAILDTGQALSGTIDLPSDRS